MVDVILEHKWVGAETIFMTLTMVLCRITEGLNIILPIMKTISMPVFTLVEWRWMLKVIFYILLVFW